MESGGGRRNGGQVSPHQGRALGVGHKPWAEIHGLAVGAAHVLVVFGGAPSEGTDSAGKDDGGLENAKLVDVGAGDAGGSGINDGAFDLKIGDADCRQFGEVLIDRGDGCFGGRQAVAKRRAELSYKGCALVEKVVHESFLGREAAADTYGAAQGLCRDLGGY